MKKIRKIQVGGREEGIRPKLPDHLLPRKKGKASEYPPQHGGVLGPHRELKKEEQLYLKDQVDYKHATPQQLSKGEQCSTCIYWKDGAACHIVLGFIDADMWCNKWEKAEVLTVKPVHALQELIESKKEIEVYKEDGGGDGGGALAEGGTVFTSTNSGVFNPTYGGNGQKKKKKTGIERLGQFITENSPQKKMVKDSDNPLTKMIQEVSIELRKEDEKRQVPYKSKPTEDDPPQVIETEVDGATEDPDLVTEQDNTEKEQNMKKDWNSGGTDVDALHQGGDKDELESDEESNEPEEFELPEEFNLDLSDEEEKKLKEQGDIMKGWLERAEILEKEEGLTFFEGLSKAIDEDDS